MRKCIDSATLRPYQDTMIDNLRGALSAHRSAIAVLPTGGGKTVIFSAICAQAKTPVLILVHRVELLQQASRSLTRAGVEHEVIAPRHALELCKSTPGAAVTLATVQSAARREIRPPGLIIADEAHHAVCGSWASVMERFPAARVLGFTATPCRLDGSGLSAAFASMVMGPTVSALVADGYLCPVRAYSVASVDMVGVRESDTSAVSARVAPIVGCAVDQWETIGCRRPAIAFCHSVEAAQSLAERFIARGVSSACIDGTMTAQARAEATNGLHSGAVEVLTSCEIVSEGFDCPGAEVAILLRPTQSLGLHLQQIGRVMRTAPGKTHGIVIDAVGNVLRHGLPDDPRAWSLDGATKRHSDGVTAVSVRTCPDCFRCFRPAQRCPYCGCSIPIKPRSVELVDGALREWSKAELAAAREAARIAGRQEVRAAAKLGINGLKALAQKRGYSPGWVYQYAKARKITH